MGTFSAVNCKGGDNVELNRVTINESPKRMKRRKNKKKKTEEKKSLSHSAIKIRHFVSFSLFRDKMTIQRETSKSFEQPTNT